MPQTDALTDHRLTTVEDGVTSIATNLDHIVNGNGKPGLRERLARLEWAFLVLLVMVATSSPVANSMLKALGK